MSAYRIHVKMVARVTTERMDMFAIVLQDMRAYTVKLMLPFAIQVITVYSC